MIEYYMSDDKSKMVNLAINVISIILGSIIILYLLFFLKSPLAWYYKFFVELFGWGLFIFGFRKMIWKAELKDWKYLSTILVMFFSILFSYGLNRQIKNTLMPSTSAGPGIIPMLKIFNGFLCTLYAIYYNKMAKKFSLKHMVVVALAPILLFFGCFSLFMLNSAPYSGAITGDALFNPAILPNISAGKKLLGFIPLPEFIRLCLNVWPAAMYYCVSELWIVGTLVLSFWKVINILIPKSDSKRLVPIIMAVAQISTLFSSYVNGSFKFLDYRTTLNWSVFFSFLCGAVIIGCSYLLFNMFPEPKKSVKKKTAVNETVTQLIKKNPEFLFISCLNIFFGAVTVIFEGFQRSVAFSVFTDRASISAFNTMVSATQSRLALLLSLFFTNLAPKYFNWFWQAIPAPIIVVFGGGAMFFVYLFMKMCGIPGADYFVIYFGSVMIGLYKSFKYAAIDPCKESFMSEYEKSDQVTMKFIESSISRYGKSLPSLLIYAINGPQKHWSMFMVSFAFILSQASGFTWGYMTNYLHNALKRQQSKNKEDSDNKLDNKKV